MDLSPYIDNLRRELLIAAEAGGDDARTLAERLTAPLESAARLALLDALSAAAEEITSDLAPGSVDVRLRGRDPDFVVTPPPVEFGEEGGSNELQIVEDNVQAAAAEADDGGTSRITLRLPEHLKPRIDFAAGRAGMSVNAWLVRAVSAALSPTNAGSKAGKQGGFQIGQHYTGWAR